MAWRSERAAIRRWLTTAAAVVLGEVIALVSLGVLYAHAVGLELFINVLAGRAHEQSGLSGGFLPLIYIESLGWYCGPYLLLLACSVVAALIMRGRSPGSSLRSPVAGPLVAVMGFTCIENLVLARHAIDYGFDELKVVLLVVLILSWAYSIIVQRGGTAVLLLSSGLAAALSVVIYYPLYGDRWDAASGRMSSQTTCMRVGRDAAADIRRTLRPEDLLMITPSQDVELFLGRVGDVVTSVGQAEADLDLSAQNTGRLYVLGDTGFNGRSDKLGTGRVSAVILLRRASDQAEVTLYPTDRRIFQGDTILRLPNARAAALLPVGTDLTTADEQPTQVLATDPGTGRITLLGEISSTSAASLIGRVKVSHSMVVASLEVVGEKSDFIGCSAAEKPDEASVFPWVSVRHAR